MFTVARISDMTLTGSTSHPAATEYMDLRRLVSSRSQVERAKKLAMRGVMNYQPFTFADDLVCGSGLSIVRGHGSNPPSIYCPDVRTGEHQPPERRAIG